MSLRRPAKWDRRRLFFISTPRVGFLFSSLKCYNIFITKTNKEVFEKELNIWFLKRSEFLKERTIDYETNKWFYTHKRLRSAYRSLKNNLPYLFTYQEHKELYIPNTTNSLDGFFSHFKERINVHRGLKINRKKRMIIEILKGESD